MLSSLTRLLPSLPSVSLPSLPSVSLPSFPPSRGRRHRRFWTRGDRAHIEVRTATRPGSEPFAQRLEERLTALEGVDWATVNGVTGRAIVAFDSEAIDVGALLDVVEELEEAEGVADERFSHARSEHPGDRESLRAAGMALVADVAGMGLGAAGQLLRSTPIPAEVGAVFSYAEDQPRIRMQLEERLGPFVTDIGLALGNALGQGLSQGPLGLAVDAAHRLNLVAAARSRLGLWERMEPVLTASAEAARADAVAVQDRPVPLPRGPVESYLNRAGVAGLLSGGATYLAMGSLRRAASMVLAATGKPTRLGRETFSAHLERALARRGILVLDQRAIRRLDRVDCLLVAGDVIRTGRSRAEHLVVVPGTDRPTVHRHLRQLFDPDRRDRVRRRRGWAVGPLDQLAANVPPEAEAVVQAFDGERPFALVHDGDVVAVFDIAPELDPGIHLVADTARRHGIVVAVADDDPRTITRLHADLLVEDGELLHDSVSSLQRDGRVVAVLGTDHHASLRRADVGLGLFQPGAFPWGAHLVVNSLEDVWFVLESCAVAHEVDRQGNALALSGSSVASMLALTSPERSAGFRATTTVNVASIVAMANAVRAVLLLAHQAVPDVGRPPRWHELSRGEVLRLLDSSLEGLADEDVRARREPRATRLPAPARFVQAVAAEMANPLTPVLAGSALLAATVGSITDAGIVFSVVALNGLISGVQRFSAENAVRSLVAAGSVTAHVRRGGTTIEVPADDLVPGDIVVLEAGDTVPADCRILHAESLEVDEASLTGESEPVTKRSSASFSVLVSERASMLYAGTAIAAGSAVGAVVATGDHTQAAGNDAARDNGSFPPHDGIGATGPPSVVGVEARLRDLSAISLPIAGASGVIVTVSQLLRGVPLQTSLAGGVSLAVAAVPEGLPMLATVGQLTAARRLSARDVLVRNPRAVEALGRVDVLCADKTGTLTEGRVVVREISDGRVARGLDDLPGRYRDIVAAAADASPTGNGERSLPHFTDRAIIAAAESLAPQRPGRGRARLGELVFGPERAFHAAWDRSPDRQQVVLRVKGAPENVLELCTAWRRARGDRSLGADDRRRLDRHVDDLARRGFRVLAVAERVYLADTAPSPPTDVDVAELVLLGFVALADPIRGSAALAVTGLREAGVDLVMVTGDHPSTAEGIAAELGILGGRRVLTGGEIEQLSDEALDAVVAEVSVFARVTPAHKVRIVSAFQRLGRSVAMTGDGANDANAIRRADVGIALGRNSTPAARSAADVIITDDRIETIVDAIIEGRALWASVRDALAILLGGNLGEIGFILLSGGIGGRPTLSPRQVLLVNLLTDVAPSLAIVSRPPPGRSTTELAREGPERSLGSQLNTAITQRALATAAGASVAWTIARYTGRPQRASTVGLAALVGSQLGQTLTAGHFDPVVAASAIGSAVVLAGIIQTPGVSQFFGCTPLGPFAWSIALGSSVGATVAALALPDKIDLVVQRLGRHLEEHPDPVPA